MNDYWWDGDPSEIHWLETTDRSDVGVDLNAPQRDERGKPHWSYSFILEVQAGDLVFHYRMQKRAITGWSRAVGKPWADDVVWSAHAPTSRGVVVKPYKRPGWRIGLEVHTNCSNL